ncbi:MAG TPA: UDP-N-acetylglucosamine--N-acetylmuramyl-(pentapeptide) pyrophosphoryl-undecaprenol N-acetylglucosamine transferase, partial [Planctomycetota bacterium]|nr:UDP-N-acetylglucosamine--N-acetylmuramyl-(pentapeptide) pyrophosphoryl-undecaprenol N-acetylglucosamine transferase [Planctomycetota bacterium]
MRSSSRLRVLFAGGGTGGHLFPGLEVARALVEATSGAAECVFWGTGRPAEKRAFEGTPFAHDALPAAPWRGVNRLPGFVWGTFGALRAARRRVKALAPDIVVGLGGYASAAPAASAALGGTPLFVLEQNAVPGRANRLLSRIARAVFVPWAAAARHFPAGARVEAAGNPVRKAVLEPVGDARAELGLSREKRTLLV